MAKGKFEQARVLVAFTLYGVQLQCNQLLESDAETIKGLVKTGEVDNNPKAVTYCIKELKQEPVTVPNPKIEADAKAAEEMASAAAAVKEAEAAVKAAEDALKSAKSDEEKSAALTKLVDANVALADLKK